MCARVGAMEGGSVGVNMGMIVGKCTGSTVGACTVPPLINPRNPIVSTAHFDALATIRCSARRGTHAANMQHPTYEAHLRWGCVGRLVGWQIGRHNVRRGIKGHHGRRGPGLVGQRGGRKSGRKCLNARRQHDGHLCSDAVRRSDVCAACAASHRTAVGESVGAEVSILFGTMTMRVFFGSGTAKSTDHLKS